MDGPLGPAFTGSWSCSVFGTGANGTKRACPAPRMAQERRFADAFGSTPGYRIASDTLRLTGAGGDTLAVLRLDVGSGS